MKEVILQCRDLRVEIFQFSFDHFLEVQQALLPLMPPKIKEDLFAYSFRCSKEDRAYLNGWNLLRLGEEYVRQGVCASKWQISIANSSYDLCKEYPSQFLFPQSSITPDVLQKAADYRARRKFPLVSWYMKTTKCLLLRAAFPATMANMVRKIVVWLLNM
tara:strand:+ start:475 stop:954 length:480 start_codon:yes stop_codon:yes gene_type:complete